MPETKLSVKTDEDGVRRCWWAVGDALYREYHDTEWGFPVDDDRRLFEKICLEGFQAGLSWITILRKRENFRRAFAEFDFQQVARFNHRSVERLVRDAGIVRHQGKIESTINNACRALEMVDEFGSLAAFFWQFEPPTAGAPKTLVAHTPESHALSKALKRRGWSFVGPTTMYALMQAMGLVNDHLARCPARSQVTAARRAFRRPT